MAEARKKPVVLVADEDFGMRLLAGTVLEGAGFESVEASDGESALRRFFERSPDVVLLDVQMSDIDGYEICRTIRSSPGGGTIPILMMTGIDLLESVDTAYEAGATDFITKPIPYTLLVHRLRYLVRAANDFRKAREGELRLSRAQRLARLVQWELSLADGSFRWSDEAAEILGIPLTSAGEHYELTQWVHPDDRERVENVLQSKQPHKLDYRIVLPGGGERIIHQEAEIVGDDPTSLRLVGAAQDMTERWVAERQVAQLVYYDSLTGLPNRAHLRAYLEHAIADADRYSYTAAVLALNLDLFKRVNDTLGHAAGDALLVETAARLKSCIRGGDAVGHEVNPSRSDVIQHESETLAGRIGGDEFTVVLSHIRSAEDAAIVARRVLERVNEKYVIDGAEVFISGSIGIATYPESGHTTEELFDHADAAMHLVKDGGRNNFQFFTRSIQERARRRTQIEKGLRAALGRIKHTLAGESGGPIEFELHFQPKVELPSRRAAGVEALVRWTSSELGPISPAEFVPVAEDAGLIVSLGEWILRSACTFGRDLPNGLGVAVNISPRQLQAPNFAAMVAATLQETGMPAHRLELEITEGVVMQDTASSLAFLSQLKQLGVRVTLDDFGTGYSSLSYLTRFPIDVLKIDRSFVRNLNEKRNEAIVLAIIAMSNSLGLDLVVEGVETEEQMNFFRQCGEIEIQGYYFAKPMPRAELLQWLSRHAVRDAGPRRVSSRAPRSRLPRTPSV